MSPLAGAHECPLADLAPGVNLTETKTNKRLSVLASWTMGFVLVGASSLAAPSRATLVSGTVRTVDNVPVAGALVTFTGEQDPTESLSDVTDQDGRYQIDGLTTTAVEQTGSTPPFFELYQNYPNPFNPSTVIAYVLVKPGYTTVEIFNSLGQKVRTLVDS